MLVRTGATGLSLPSGRPVAAALGYFDGLHRGHRRIMEATVEGARRLEGLAAVIGFDPHPLAVIAPERRPPLILTPGQKRERLAAWGLDALVLVPFDREMAGWSGEAFAERILAGALKVAELHVGADFRFGRDRSSDVADLERLGRRLGFRTVPVPAVVEDGDRISASRIRRHLREGKVAEAARLLGRPYGIRGRVVAGAGRGRRLSFPTANLEPENEIFLARGVYVTETAVAETRRHGLTNVGVRPTFGETALTVETFLPGFEGDLYDAPAELLFHARVREERAFPSAEALQEQIRDDLRALDSFLRGRGSSNGAPAEGGHSPGGRSEP